MFSEVRDTSTTHRTPQDRASARREMEVDTAGSAALGKGVRAKYYSGSGGSCTVEVGLHQYYARCRTLDLALTLSVSDLV